MDAIRVRFEGGGGEGLHVLLVLDIFDIAPTVGYNISTS